jgi:rhodanese-related sulfurtransferase
MVKKRIVRKSKEPKQKKINLLNESIQIIYKSIIIVVVSTIIALTYTGIRAALNVDNKTTSQTAATAEAVSNTTNAVAETPQPTPTPTRVYHIPFKYRNLFNEHSKKEDIPRIHLEEAKVLFESGKALFIDARSASEYNDAHIPGAILITVAEAPTKIPQLKDVLKDKVLVPYCHGAGCHLSDKVAYSLFDAGYKKVVIYFGGWPEWTQANMPVEKYEPPAQYKHLFEEAASEKDIKQITLEEAKFLYDSGLANFIDVDTQDKYNKMHIDRAVTIPVDKMKDMLRGYDYFLKQKPNVLYCHGRGGKAKQAASMLYKEGYKKLLLFINAIPQWEKAGYNLWKMPPPPPTQNR